MTILSFNQFRIKDGWLCFSIMEETTYSKNNKTKYAKSNFIFNNSNQFYSFNSKVINQKGILELLLSESTTSHFNDYLLSDDP